MSFAVIVRNISLLGMNSFPSFICQFVIFLYLPILIAKENEKHFFFYFVMLKFSLCTDMNTIFFCVCLSFCFRYIANFQSRGFFSLWKLILISFCFLSSLPLRIVYFTFIFPLDTFTLHFPGYSSPLSVIIVFGVQIKPRCCWKATNISLGLNSLVKTHEYSST